MTVYRVTFTVDLDDDALADWDGEKAAPPNDLADWIASDLFEAHSLGIVGDSDDLEMERVDTGVEA